MNILQTNHRMYSFGLLLFAVLLFQGCVVGQQPNTIVYEYHKLDLRCYDASDLKVVYDGDRRTKYSREYENGHKRVIAPSKQAWHHELLHGFTSPTYTAFSGPVHVTWNSLDETQLSCTLNLDEIFKDKSIPYEQKPEEIYWMQPMDFAFTRNGMENSAVIVLEVIDRTLNLYLDTFVHVRDKNVSGKYHRVRLHKLVFSITL